ncbi:MAG: hypothetical protein GY865_02405 [candidate division Zixibacteria bacterium]|nr:hypothetical protein [candidate division Zixibacteria bacterium]
MRILITFIFTVFFTILSVTAQDKTQSINSYENAKSLATKYMGIKPSKNFNTDNQILVDSTIISNDKTPFIHKMINNKKSMRVVFQDILLNTIREMNYDIPDVDFEVLLDPESGKLLKIWSRLKDTSYIVPRPESPTIVEDQLKSGKIEYIGLPDKDPFPFFETLKNCPFSFEKAVEIEAIYVIKKTKKYTEGVPVWIVSIHGLPRTISPPPRNSDSGESNTLARTILTSWVMTFDGITGEYWTSSGGGK